MVSSLTVEAKVGKKYAIYLPRAVVKALGLREGEKVLLRLSGTTLLLESLQDPIQLGVSGKKFAFISPERVEAISLEEQSRSTENPA